MITSHLLAFGIPSGPDLLVLSALGLILPIWATIIALKRFRGTALPLWLILTWFIAVIGPIITIIAAYSRKPDNDAKLIP